MSPSSAYLFWECKSTCSNTSHFCHQLSVVSLEELVSKNNRITVQLSEAPSGKLSCEGGKLGGFEVLWKNLPCELVGIAHHMLIVLHTAATVFFATFNGKYLRYEHELQKKADEERKAIQNDGSQAFHPFYSHHQGDYGASTENERQPLVKNPVV